MFSAIIPNSAGLPLAAAGTFQIPLAFVKASPGARAVLERLSEVHFLDTNLDIAGIRRQVPELGGFDTGLTWVLVRTLCSPLRAPAGAERALEALERHLEARQRRPSSAAPVGLNDPEALRRALDELETLTAGGRREPPPRNR